MEIDYDETKMQCFKIGWNIEGNLKISCDFTSSTIVLWSKYQLFVYENLNFRTCARKVEPEFEIDDVIVMQGCLICLDCSGNVNIDTFDSFIIWRDNIKCICSCEIQNAQYLVSLQFKANIATVLVNKIDINESPNQSAGLEFKMPNEDWMIPRENSIMVCGYIKSKCSKRINKILNTRETNSNYLLVVISFDNRNLYAVLFPIIDVHDEPQIISPNFWVKLHKTYTDIIGIKITMIDDIYILVGLAGGNILKIPFLLKNQKLEAYHLNTAVNKFIMIGNTVIYSDALTMWKNGNIFSKSDSTFKQFLVRNIRDFCLIKSQVICVTFSNLIYSFNVDHTSSYIEIPDADYSCPVELVTNSDCLVEIMEAVKKNGELLKKINKESEYLMALSLSKRRDIMDDLIKITASVFDDYKDLASKHMDLVLTDEPNTYCDNNSHFFLINIFVNRVHHKLNKLISEVLGDIKIHITLFESGVLKTTSIQIKEQLTTKNFVISLKSKNKDIKRMQVHVKIITNIPGKFDDNQSLWTILYQKCIVLNAENFINMKTVTKSTLLKEETSLEMLILNRAKHLHGTEYKIRFVDFHNHQWMFFIKLPDASNLHMEDILNLIDPSNSKKAFVFLKNEAKVSKEKNWLEFQIGKEKVRLHIDGENLIVYCPNIIIASEIRNFFSRIIFNKFKDKLGHKLIDHKYYTTVENLKRDVINCISKKISTEEFATLFTRFLGNIYRLIPI